MRLLVLLLTLVSGNLVFAQPVAQKIANAYAAFEKDPQLQHGISSLCVLNARTGETVFARNERLGMAPASTLKTITSVTAYDLLGQEHAWETLLGYTGNVEAGVLKGDIVITGSGDPSLGSDRYNHTKPELLLNRWLAAVRRAGIRKVEGRIIADERLFGTETVPKGWIWQDMGNYYGAGASALSWRENQIGLLLKPGPRAGDPVSLQGTRPAAPFLNLVNELSTGRGGSGDNVYAYSAPYSNLVYLRGTYGIGLNKTIMISAPDPAYWLAHDLRDKLQAEAVPVSGAATTSRMLSLEKESFKPASTEIDRYTSPALGSIVYWLNRKSINLYAENILKTMALKQGEDPGFEAGVKVMQSHWAKRLGVDAGEMAILDGSGLSPENRMTTAAMTRILHWARSQPWYGSFYESLPLYNNMKMKSGSIRNVLGYAGYHKGADGNEYVFCFLSNNYKGSTSAIRQKMFSVLNALK